MQAAYYAASVSTFLADNPERILGHLTSHHAHDLVPLQRHAWIEQIALLKRELVGFKSGSIAFEFAIPRMGKRVDTVIILDGIIFLLEFKINQTHFTAAANDQVMDYALDLKNFHAGSHHRPIVPIVVATKAANETNPLVWTFDGIAEPLLSCGDGLGVLLSEIVLKTPTQAPLDMSSWASSGYKPTPTITEAAQALYRGHRVEEITRSDAGAKNLRETTECLERIIDESKVRGHKSICFVTGVPGAGKTLAGLNLVTHRTKAHEEEHAVFLSGNGPLVKVLCEALARDDVAQAKEVGQVHKKKHALSKVRKFIQNIHHFRDANLISGDAPIERVAVFDEAQRAWDKYHAAKFMAQKKRVLDFDMSEPEFLISVMNRHAGWCTIVCLVGGGQEINAGEAGLTEWFAALKKSFPGWKIYTSPQLAHRDYHWGQDLAGVLAGLDYTVVAELHLAVSVRSFRAEKLSDFVGALIVGETSVARALYEQIKDVYPVVLTRDLRQAKIGYADMRAAPSDLALLPLRVPRASSRRESMSTRKSTLNAGFSTTNQM